MLSSIKRIPEKRFDASVFSHDFINGNLTNSPVNMDPLDRKCLYNKDTIFFTKSKTRFDKTKSDTYWFYFYSAKSKKAFCISYIVHYIKTTNSFYGRVITDEAQAHVNADIVNNIHRVGNNIEYRYKGNLSGAKKFIYKYMNYKHIKSVKFFLEYGSLL